MDRDGRGRGEDGTGGKGHLYTYTVEPHLSGRRSSGRLGLPGSCYSKPAILLLRTLTSRLPRR